MRTVRVSLALVAIAVPLSATTPARAQLPTPAPTRAPARAPEDAVDSSAYAAALAGLPRGAQADLSARLDAARASGIPVAPLRRKVIEGVAKRADAAQIVTVVRVVSDALRAARAALGPTADAELEAAGAAVQAGVTPEQLRQLRTGLPRGRSFTQAVVVLTDLARRGVAPSDGARTIVRLARAGAGDAELAQWRAEVAADVAAGLGGRIATSRRADAFLRTHPGADAPIPSPVPGPLDP